MKRSTHLDRAAAWAAKQEKQWHKTKKFIPTNDSKNQ
jgi:hypothetical protein